MASAAAAKAHAKAVGIARQLGRPLTELTNDLPRGGAGYGGADGVAPLNLSTRAGELPAAVGAGLIPTFGRRAPHVDVDFGAAEARSALDSLVGGGDGRMPIGGLDAGFPG